MSAVPASPQALGRRVARRAEEPPDDQRDAEGDGHVEQQEAEDRPDVPQAQTTEDRRPVATGEADEDGQHDGREEDARQQCRDVVVLGKHRQGDERHHARRDDAQPLPRGDLDGLAVVVGEVVVVLPFDEVFRNACRRGGCACRRVMREP